MTDTAPQHALEGILDILKEAVEGGQPGQGTAFLDGTGADGSGNHGLLATLEVVVRWERDGERGPFDWKGSFQPAQVDEEQWRAVRNRVRRAYDELTAFTRTRKDGPVNGDVTGGLTGAVAHVAYHLGALRQMAKAVEAGA